MIFDQLHPTMVAAVGDVTRGVSQSPLRRKVKPFVADVASMRVMTTDADLLGTDATFDAFVHRHRTMLRRYVVRRLGAPLISKCGSGVGGPFTEPDGTTHAAMFTTFAPVAPEIARVELRSTDGRTFPGTVGNGWYLIVASTRGPMRALNRGTVVGYDADGDRVATARLSASP